MREKLLDLLACPKCRGELSCDARADASGEIAEGRLACAGCNAVYPITKGIPRFVEMDNYAASFGYQWNRFRLEQIDSTNGTRLSEKRFVTETGWTDEWLRGKWVLDAGCGAGRFLDVASKTGAEVVGLDISSAVDAARENLAGRANAHFVQASIFEPPFRDGAFDACYCIGVIQHTPDPRRALRALPRVVRAGGRLAVTIYERKPWTLLNTKYLVRPVTKRLKKQTLLSLIRGAMPVLFPVTEVAFRVPYLGRLLNFVIPVANYVHERELSARQRYRWAILDTFDMLSPQYDQPQTRDEVEEALAAEGVVDIQRMPTAGLNLVGRKRAGDEGAGPASRSATESNAAVAAHQVGGK